MNASYEKLIAHEIAVIVPDLRLIDLSHYVCHLHQGQYGSIADLVDDVCNCYFHPLTLRFANKGDFSLGWDSSPTVRLLMKFNNLGISASFYLTLKPTCFSIVLKQLECLPKSVKRFSDKRRGENNALEHGSDPKIATDALDHNNRPDISSSQQTDYFKLALRNARFKNKD